MQVPLVRYSSLHSLLLQQLASEQAGGRRTIPCTRCSSDTSCTPLQSAGGGGSRGNRNKTRGRAGNRMKLSQTRTSGAARSSKHRRIGLVVNMLTYPPTHLASLVRMMMKKSGFAAVVVVQLSGADLHSIALLPLDASKGVAWRAVLYFTEALHRVSLAPLEHQACWLCSRKMALPPSEVITCDSDP